MSATIAALRWAGGVVAVDEAWRARPSLPTFRAAVPFVTYTTDPRVVDEPRSATAKAVDVSALQMVTPASVCAHNCVPFASHGRRPVPFFGQDVVA